jgi:hypothetical protein
MVIFYARPGYLQSDNFLFFLKDLPVFADVRPVAFAGFVTLPACAFADSLVSNMPYDHIVSWRG